MERNLDPNSNGLLQDYVQSLFDEGIVNDQFSQVLTLKTEDEPDSVLKLINAYLNDAEAILSEFPENILAAQARKISEISLCIGAEHMKLACSDLIQACDEKQGRRFFQAVGWTKMEFSRTRGKLDALVQMEKRILRLKSKQNRAG
ncbi:histidine-containing phosphotransfer protein 2-like isoform X2 [Punica granatum]|uniref:Histidine-containing phosphotransfer protein n=1 Tax=Punica granatum TaxID=22663 RepID=A0A6P8CM89_PUNGR|nr:histidine-containing phosphotransfer protein 2-like isoform X2 [Punica granatum]